MPELEKEKFLFHSGPFSFSTLSDRVVYLRNSRTLPKAYMQSLTKWHWRYTSFSFCFWLLIKTTVCQYWNVIPELRAIPSLQSMLVRKRCPTSMVLTWPFWNKHAPHPCSSRLAFTLSRIGLTPGERHVYSLCTTSKFHGSWSAGVAVNTNHAWTCSHAMHFCPFLSPSSVLVELFGEMPLRDNE